MPDDIGHNNPPLADRLKLLLDTLPDDLEKTTLDLAVRRNDLLASGQRAPQVIADEPTAEKFADAIRQINAAVKLIETHRTGTKEPFLAGGKLVDGVYRKISDPLLDLKKEMERRLTVYQREKEAKARREREEAARLAREAEEAARREAEAAAAAMASAQDLDAAVMAEQVAAQAAADAERARKDAEVKAADLSRSRGELGAVASLRTFWTFRDLDRDRIDLEKLRPHLPLAALEAALNAYIRAGGREIAGAVIFEDTKTTVR